MPLPVINNVVRVAVAGLMGGGAGHWVNVHHFLKTSGAIDTTALFALNAEIERLYAGTPYTSGLALLASCNSGTILQSCTYTPLDGSSASTVLVVSGGGSGSVESLPHEVAEVCTHRTALRGRRYRGRTYLPPVTESNTDGSGRLGGTVVSGWGFQWIGFRAGLVANNWQHVVASYLAPAVGTPVTSTTIDSVFDVQRRRKA